MTQKSAKATALKMALVTIGIIIGATLPFAYAQENATQAKTLEERVAALEKRIAKLEQNVAAQTKGDEVQWNDLLRRSDARGYVLPYCDARPLDGKPFAFNGQTYYLTPLK